MAYKLYDAVQNVEKERHFPSVVERVRHEQMLGKSHQHADRVVLFLENVQSTRLNDYGARRDENQLQYHLLHLEHAIDIPAICINIIGAKVKRAERFERKGQDRERRRRSRQVLPQHVPIADLLEQIKQQIAKVDGGNCGWVALPRIPIGRLWRFRIDQRPYMVQVTVARNWTSDLEVGIGRI